MSPRIEKSALETLTVSMKEEIISEMKGMILDSQRELLKQLNFKPEGELYIL